MEDIKPPFTEKEIEELTDLNSNWGYIGAVLEIKTFLKSLRYSDVNAVVVAIRKEFDKRIRDRQLKHQETYKDSTLMEKLCNRMDWTQKQKEIKSEENIK